jgi:hypothetical protein
MSDNLPDNILQKSSVTGPFHAKIGTYTPKQIWIHKDDIPVEEGDRFRFVKTNPEEKHEDWGSERTAGVVDEIRQKGPRKLIFVTEMTYYEGFLNKTE